MDPAAFAAELLAQRIDECGRVVIGELFDLGDSLRRRNANMRTNFRHVVGRNDSELRPCFQRGELDVEPAGELALVRPDPGHGRAGVAGDH